MQAPRILLRLECERTGAPRPVDPHLLDPGQPAGAEQALGDRIEAPDELVAEPEHGVVSFRPLFDQLRKAQVREGEMEIEASIDQKAGHGLLGSVDVVLSVEAHGSSRGRRAFWVSNSASESTPWV